MLSTTKALILERRLPDPNVVREGEMIMQAVTNNTNESIQHLPWASRLLIHGGLIDIHVDRGGIN